MRIAPLPLLLLATSLSAQTTPAPATPSVAPAAGTSAPTAQTAPTTQAPQPAKQAPVTTIRAQTKLVVVDVVVTDRDHHPVHNLKQADFSLLEGGQPQTIKSFDANSALTATEAAKFPPIPPMPPGIFTNYTPTPTNKAVNILLLDALNTPLQDQAYVRQQLLNYLKTPRPGTNMAIFGLSTKLVMLQGFTSNPEVLKRVVEKSNGKASVLLDDVVGGGGPTPTVDDTMGDILPADVIANMQTFMDIQQSFQLMLRAKYTLDAMNVLARYLSSIPGRKNLIWFSGSFPLDILPDGDNGASDPFAAVADSEEEYRETTNLLARAQVAVYPIDGRGLQVSPTLSAANSGSQYARNPKAFARDETKFFNANADEHSTMNRMADDTGGHAFYNTNGLAAAVDKAIEDGSTYYTLTYSPTNNVWKGDFRKIQVKLAQQGYTLEYRHGYYADDPNSKDSAVTTTAAGTGVDLSGSSNHDPTLILKAMAHGVPAPSQIVYKVRIIPTSGENEDTVAKGNIVNGVNAAANVKGPYRRYSIDFAAIPGNISYTATADKKFHATVEFVSVVYQPDGVLINRISNVVQASLTVDQLKSLVHGGFPFHQEISVPIKGDYSIRTAVHDVNANTIGATEISVASVKNLPPASTFSPPAPATPATPAQSTPAPSTPATPAAAPSTPAQAPPPAAKP